MTMHFQGIAFAVEADIKRLMQGRQTLAKDIDHRPMHFLDHAKRQ